MDEFHARLIAKQAGELGANIALKIFCEELRKQGVPIEVINRAIDTMAECVAEARRRQEAGEPLMIEGRGDEDQADADQG